MATQNKPKKKNIADLLPKAPSLAEANAALDKRKAEQKKLEELTHND